VAIIAVIWSRSRRSPARTARLQQVFGPEYEHAVEDHGDVQAAERELLARERRVRKLRLRDLTAAEQARLMMGWQGIQGRFVDDPHGAVSQAADLLEETMRARGYPTRDFDRRVADLSVHHGHVVQHYRAAFVLANEPQNEGRTNTEAQRQALVHYRALLDELIQPKTKATIALKEAHQ
jgi:hypothetical protein